MDLVRLNAVQPGMVPPLATGYKVIDLDADLAAALKQWSRDNLARQVDAQWRVAGARTFNTSLACVFLQCQQRAAGPRRA